MFLFGLLAGALGALFSILAPLYPVLTLLTSWLNLAWETGPWRVVWTRRRKL